MTKIKINIFIVFLFLLLTPLSCNQKNQENFTYVKKIVSYKKIERVKNNQELFDRKFKIIYLNGDESYVTLKTFNKINVGDTLCFKKLHNIPFSIITDCNPNLSNCINCYNNDIPSTNISNPNYSN